MKKTHKHDTLLAGFFVLAVVGMFAYLYSHMLTNSRAAGLNQKLQQKIEACYENHRGTCPPWEEIKNSKDKKDKGCIQCHSKCNFCVIAERVSDKNCEVDCGAATVEDVFGDPLPTLEPTEIP